MVAVGLDVVSLEMCRSKIDLVLRLASGALVQPRWP